MSAASIPSPDLCGIGIDLAEPSAFDHLNADAVARAARRWLTPDEHAWCTAQPRFREAMVTLLSCKESVFKASAGLVPVYQVSLRLEGDWRSGWGRSEGSPGPVTVRWEVSRRRVLTLAAVGPEDRSLLNRLILQRHIIDRRRAEESL